MARHARMPSSRPESADDLAIIRSKLTPDAEWQQFLSDLGTVHQEPVNTWGEIDEALVARYIVGECFVAEQQAVEAAMAQHSDLRECIELNRELNRGLDSAA